MTRAQHLSATLAAILDGDPWYAPPLKTALDGVSAVTAAARPLGGAHSIWEITLHLDAWNRVCLRRLAGEAVEEPPADFPTPGTIGPAEWREARMRLDASCRELMDRAARLSGEDLERVVAGKDYTADFLIEGAGQHWIYHGGQISLLGRAMRSVVNPEAE